MTIFKEVIAELFGMFVADMRLTAAILTVVAAAAGLVDLVHLPTLVAGIVLLAGSLAALFGAVLVAAWRQR